MLKFEIYICEYLELFLDIVDFSAPSLSVSVSPTDTWRAVIALAFRALQLSWYQSIGSRSLAVGHELLRTVSNDESG